VVLGECAVHSPSATPLQNLSGLHEPNPDGRVAQTPLSGLVLLATESPTFLDLNPVD